MKPGLSFKEVHHTACLTIEPGIYFIPELTDQWRAQKKFTEFLNYDEIDKFRNFGGIRNEINPYTEYL